MLIGLVVIDCENECINNLKTSPQTKSVIENHPTT